MGRVVAVFNFAVEGRGESWGVCKVEDVAVVLVVNEEGWRGVGVFVVVFKCPLEEAKNVGLALVVWLWGVGWVVVVFNLSAAATCEVNEGVLVLSTATPDLETVAILCVRSDCAPK